MHYDIDTWVVSTIIMVVTGNLSGFYNGVVMVVAMLVAKSIMLDMLVSRL